MCLVIVALGVARGYRLVVAANRDERHARPAAVAAWWHNRATLFGGRDLTAGGTWLAADGRGRIAAVTNIRDSSTRDGLRSRGALVADYLAGPDTAAGTVARAAAEGAHYAAFNLLVYDGQQLYYASNRAATARLDAGLHVLSNAPRGVEWPKTASARAGAADLLAQPAVLEAWFALLARPDDPAAADYYRTTHFVVGETYGTRCSTVILVDDAGTVTFAERSFDAAGEPTGTVVERFATPSVP